MRGEERRGEERYRKRGLQHVLKQRRHSVEYRWCSTGGVVQVVQYRWCSTGFSVFVHLQWSTLGK
jgi:hypothetical protein